MSKKINGNAECGMRNAKSFGAYSELRTPNSTLTSVVSRGKWPPDWWHHRGVIFILLSAMFFTSIIPSSWSEQKAQKEKIERKIVAGKVMASWKRGISVEYEVTSEGSYEMLLPLTPETKFRYVKGPSELQYGDIVEVVYEQTYREDNPGERTVLATKAIEIKLVKRASPELSSGEDVSLKSGVTEQEKE